jgi:gallate dioxygenase
VSETNYDLNRYLQQMTEPAHRAAFLVDEDASLANSGLDAATQDLIRRRDWTGLIEKGAIFFGVEKLAAVLGLPNAVVYAGMRGDTLEEFQASRNAPGALYSVGRSLADKSSLDKRFRMQAIRHITSLMHLITLN